MARKSRKQRDAASLCSCETADLFYRAAAYIRLSSDDKKKRGDSLDTQRNIIENFIATAPDIQLIEVYSDNNATGTNFERPDFQRMLLEAEAGKINCIIVKDLTRFGRNAIDAGYYLEKYLPALGIRFIAVTDDFDTNNGDGGIIIPLKNVIAESYALDIGRKCRAVQRQNIHDGRFVGRLAPYGYKKSPMDCHKLVIDEETVPIVRQIFDWAGRGWSMGEIVRSLNDAKVPTPSRYKQGNGLVVGSKEKVNDNWQQRTVRDLLTARVYVGDMVQGKTRKVNHKQIDVNPDQWVCVSDTHEPIVSRELFETVQQVMKAASERDKKSRRKTVAYSENVLKGKVFCAQCGHPMHRNKQSNHDYYWFRCESRWKIGKEACTVVSVKEAEVTTEILTLLHKHAEVILGNAAILDRAMRTTDDTELRTINRSLDKDGRMLRSLYENMISGIISAEEFVGMKADYEAKIVALSDRANEIRNAKRKTDNKATAYRSIVEMLSEALCNERLTAEIIDCLVEKILVHPNKSFEIYLRFENEFKGVCA